MWGIWLTDDRLASQEGLRSMELVFCNGQYNATLKNNIFNRSLIAGATRNELNFVKKNSLDKAT